MCDSGTTLTKEADQVYGGKLATVCRAEQDGTTSLSFFDKSSGLYLGDISDVKITKNHKDVTVKNEIHYDDYRKIDGLMVPMEMRCLRDGKEVMKMTIQDIKFMDKIDRKIFAKPKEGFDSQSRDEDK